MMISLALFLAAVAIAPAETKSDVTRVFRPERLDRGNLGISVQQPFDRAAWVWHPAHKEAENGLFLKFRKRFTARAEPLVFDVSADERFVLTLDGAVIARGPNRGTPMNWAYQSYCVKLAPGEHTLEAIVWTMGSEAAPRAQLSVRGGFAFKAEEPYHANLTTGTGAGLWQVGVLHGTRMTQRSACGAFGVGFECEVRGVGLLAEEGTDWTYARPVVPPLYEGSDLGGSRRKEWLAYPSQMPDQLERACVPGRIVAVRETDGDYVEDDAHHALLPRFQNLLKGARVTVPPRTKLRVLWDLEEYYSAYPLLALGRGKDARVVWGWTESLRDEKGFKRNRNTFVGKDARVVFADSFVSDGREAATFTTPWWRCGRWCELRIETKDDPLVLTGLSLVETRYPLEDEGDFYCEDKTIEKIRQICVRGQQLCAHEMTFDCPFYEQQMYPGDSRVQLQILAALSSDRRLIRRVIELFDFGRRPDGYLPMNYPCSGNQECAPYTMCWVLMLADYLESFGADDWLRARIPGLRQTMAALTRCEGEDGLVSNLPGWNFIDWAVGWDHGNPPSGMPGDPPNAIDNLFWLMALKCAATVERAVGEPELTALYTRKAMRVAQAVRDGFWDETRGLVADTRTKDAYSEHAQALAILTDVLDPERARRAFEGLVTAPDLTRATVYFSHYLFGACFKIDRGEIFLKKLDLWRDYVKEGLRTPLERPADYAVGRESRSDCHAWGSHPIYHLQRGIAGVTPLEPGFARVRIAPSPGGLKRVTTHVLTVRGMIGVDFDFSASAPKGMIQLPKGMDGVFVWKGTEKPLHAGENSVD